MSGDWTESFGTYTLKKVGLVYSCSCPSWRFQYAPISQRSCKHLVARLGYEHEWARAPLSVNKETRQKPKDRETTSFVCGPMAYRVWRSDDKTQPSDNWLWSKKLNGIFVRWQEDKLWTKSGRRLFCPRSVIEHLPSGVTLDAELYAGKTAVDRQVVRLATSGDWTQGHPKVWVFDLVSEYLNFESRYQNLTQLQKKYGFHLVKYHRFGSFKVRDILAECLKRGEEGVVFRDPDGMYDCSKSKRQASIIKAKPEEIANGVVLGIAEKRSGVTLKIQYGNIVFHLFVHKNQSRSFALGETVVFKFSGRHANETPENVRLYSDKHNANITTANDALNE